MYIQMRKVSPKYFLKPPELQYCSTLKRVILLAPSFDQPIIEVQTIFFRLEYANKHTLKRPEY